MTKRAGEVKITPDNKVIIQASSAASANELGAAARDDVLKREGTIAAWITRLQDGWQDLTEATGRPIFGLLAWVMAAVAMFFAWTSWGRIFPDRPLFSFGMSVVGVSIVIGVKVCAGRWAKEYCDRDAGGQRAFGTMVVVGILTISIVGAAYQAAIEDDRKGGVIEANVAVNELNAKIRRSAIEREDMRLNPAWSFDSQEDLSLDLTRALSRPARNRNGNPTGQPIGDHVGLGTEEFCVGTSYYVERYCPDLLDLERQLRLKVGYDKKLAQEAAWEAEKVALRDRAPSKSGTLSLAENFTGGIWSFFVAGALLLFIDVLMALFQWLATWVKCRHLRARGAAQEPAT